MREDKPIETGTLTFDLDHPDGRRAMQQALRAPLYRSFIADLQSELFRPLHKHGYEELDIVRALEAADTVKVPDSSVLNTQSGAGTTLIELLEKKFHELLEYSGISLDDG